MNVNDGTLPMDVDNDGENDHNRNIPLPGQSSNALNNISSSGQSSNSSNNSNFNVPSHFQLPQNLFNALLNSNNNQASMSNNSGDAIVQRSMSTMADMKKLSIDIHGLNRGKYTKPSTAYKKLGFDTKSTYINVLKIFNCMERKSKKLGKDACKKSIEDFVTSDLDYKNVTELYRDSNDKLGKEYAPSLTALGVNINDPQ